MIFVQRSNTAVKRTNNRAMQNTTRSAALARTVGKQQMHQMARASSELNGVGQELRVKIKSLDEGETRMCRLDCSAMIDQP